MLSLKKELRRWEANYEILLKELRGAYRFKNARACLDIQVRLLTTQDMINRCTRELEKNGYTDVELSFGAPGSRDVEISEKASVNLKCIYGDRRE
jgi:predicted transport protein